MLMLSLSDRFYRRRMKMKLKFLLMFTFMTLMMLCFSQYLLAQVSLSIDPASEHILYGDALSVSVNVAGIPDDGSVYPGLRGFEIELVYDPAFLSIAGTSAFQEGNFLSAEGQTQWYVRGSAGDYIISCAILSAIMHGATGSGTLFTVDFVALNKCTGNAGTDIFMPRYILREPLNQDIDVNPTNVTDANVKITGSQSIDLKLGWNLISSHIWPLDTDMEAVFSELKDEYLIKVQDESGDALEKNVIGVWLNNIGNSGNFEIEEGYAVQVNSDCTLIIQGCPVILPLVIPLQAGWNIVSYPYLDPMLAMSALEALINSGNLIKVQDESGDSIEKSLSGDWLDDIDYFEPGKGYKIQVNSDTDLTYPELRDATINKLALPTQAQSKFEKR